MPFDPKTDPLMKGNPATRLNNLVPVLRNVQDDVAVLKSRLPSTETPEEHDPRYDTLFQRIADLEEEQANLRVQMAEVKADNEVDDQEINALKALVNTGVALDGEQEKRLAALEAKQPTGGGGIGSTPKPPKNPAEVPEPDADGRRVARTDAQLRGLAAALQPGDTLWIAGHFDTVGTVIRVPGVKVVGEDAYLTFNKNLGSLAMDKGLLVFNLLDQYRGQPADVYVQDVGLEGATVALSLGGNAAGIRIDTLNKMTAMWRHWDLIRVRTKLCQNGVLGGGSGDKNIEDYQTEGWGRGGDGIHGIYINVQGNKNAAARTFIRGLRSRNGSAGHPYKVRDPFLDLEDVDIICTNDESYEGDHPQGGFQRARRCTWWQRSKANANRNMLAFGEERGKHGRWENAIPDDVRAQYGWGPEITEAWIFEEDCHILNTGRLIRDRPLFFGSGTEGKPPAFVALVGFEGVDFQKSVPV